MIDIYLEKKPNHYIGSNVSVTITTDDSGCKLAREIEDLIREFIKTKQFFDRCK